MRTISVLIPMSSLVRVVVGEGICTIEVGVWIGRRIGGPRTVRSLSPRFSLVKT